MPIVTVLVSLVCAHSLWCLEKTISLQLFTTYGYYNLSATSSEVPEPRDKEFGEALSFWTECSIDCVSQASETY